MKRKKLFTRKNKQEEDIQAAQAGDPEAFGRLYKTHFIGIYRFIRSRVKTTLDAEDVSSRVFLKAFEAVHSYDVQQASFKTWLFTITRRRIIDHYRTQKNHATIDELEGLPVSPDIHKKLDQNFEIKKIKNLLEALSESQREVIELRFFAELSVTETAKVLACSEDAVRALQYRALKKIRKLREQL